MRSKLGELTQAPWPAVSRNTTRCSSACISRTSINSTRTSRRSTPASMSCSALSLNAGTGSPRSPGSAHRQGLHRRDRCRHVRVPHRRTPRILGWAATPTSNPPASTNPGAPPVARIGTPHRSGARRANAPIALRRLSLRSFSLENGRGMPTTTGLHQQRPGKSGSAVEGIT